ncbi:MAG: hypothetical protein Ct9H90mP25_2050 [Gammaproteobacteria bacterium]|nr:MAG: hypothetical protein Ct9H90mP25_2050 [Gammaproteobacteria bacterium]
MPSIEDAGRAMTPPPISPENPSQGYLEPHLYQRVLFQRDSFAVSQLSGLCPHLPWQQQK